MFPLGLCGGKASYRSAKGGPSHKASNFGGEMVRKFVRRRAVIVTALPVVLAAVVVAVAGGSGARTTGNGATQAYGIARASSAGSSVGGDAALASSSTAGPQVINGQFQGTSPAVSSLP